MNRKKKQPAPKTTRNRQRSISKLVDSVGNVLALKSYSDLNITTITEYSKLNPKLIYLYFGGLDGLIEQYLGNRALQVSTFQKLSKNIASRPDAVLHEDLLSLLETYLDELISDDELKGLLHWGLSTNNTKVISALQIRENALNKALDVAKINRNIADNFDPVAFALLAAGATFLAIQAKNKGTSLLNVNLHDEDMQKKIKGLLEKLLVKN